MNKLRIILFLAVISSVYAHINDIIIIPGLKVPKELHTRVLEVDDLNDWFFANIYIGIFYYAIYLGVGSALENTNPIPKTEQRVKQTQKQMLLGLSALFYVIIGTTIWMYLIEKHGPYYGYYETHEFGVKEFFYSLFAYAFIFDAWFFVTHIILHMPYFWRTVHKLHHEFIEPSAFSQDAVHPIEAIIQGPLGHFIPTLFYPMHPVWVNLFGFLTGLYALFAHDARWDPAGHVNHHYYVNCNYGLWGFLDYIFGTKYNKKLFPVEYIPTWKRKQQL